MVPESVLAGLTVTVLWAASFSTSYEHSLPVLPVDLIDLVPVCALLTRRRPRLLRIQELASFQGLVYTISYDPSASLPFRVETTTATTHTPRRGQEHDEFLQDEAEDTAGSHQGSQGQHPQARVRTSGRGKEEGPILHSLSPLSCVVLMMDCGM